MAVCVGCGLFDPDDGVNPVRVATSGTFGGAGLDFGAGDTVGAPIYCDTNGELRAPPEHTSAPLTDGSSGGVGVGFSASAINGNTRSITLTNPSLVRACTYLLVYFCKLTVNITASSFAFRVSVVQDGGSPATRQALYWGLPTSEAYSVEQILPDQAAGTLAAAAATTFDITPGIDATSGGGAGTLVSQVVRSDAILVTQAT